jgi:predicted nucleotidyltransferase
MGQVLAVSDIKNYAAQVAQLFDLEKVSLFGSYASGKNTKESDIDLLVDFGKEITIYDIAGVKLKMEELTKKEVDIIALPIPEDSILEIEKEVLLYAKKR